MMNGAWLWLVVSLGASVRSARGQLEARARPSLTDDGEQVFERVVGGRRMLVLATALFTPESGVPLLGYLDAASSREEREGFTQRFLEFVAATSRPPAVADYGQVGPLVSQLERKVAAAAASSSSSVEAAFVAVEGFHAEVQAAVTIRVLAPIRLLTSTPVALAVDACVVGSGDYREVRPPEFPLFACVRALVRSATHEAGMLASGSSSARRTLRLDPHVARLERARLRAHGTPPWWRFDLEPADELTRQVVSLFSGRSRLAVAEVHPDSEAVFSGRSLAETFEAFYATIGARPPWSTTSTTRDLLDLARSVLKAAPPPFEGRRRRRSPDFFFFFDDDDDETEERRTDSASSDGTEQRRKCAVVGSSGLLSGSGLGGEIDGHDVVMRFNGAPVGPKYSADVGQQTSLRVANSAAPAYLMRATGVVAEPLLVVSKDVLDLVLVDLATRACDARIHLLRPSAIAEDSDAWLNANSRWPWREAYQGLSPSTGVIGVFAALRHCDTVDLYGFGIRRDAPLYYFDKDDDLVTRARAVAQARTSPQHVAAAGGGAGGGGGAPQDEKWRAADLGCFVPALAHYLVDEVYGRDPTGDLASAMHHNMHRLRDVEHGWVYERHLLADFHAAGLVRDAHAPERVPDDVHEHLFDLLAAASRRPSGRRRLPRFAVDVVRKGVVNMLILEDDDDDDDDERLVVVAQNEAPRLAMNNKASGEKGEKDEPLVALLDPADVYETLYAEHGYHDDLWLSHAGQLVELIASEPWRSRVAARGVLDVGCSHGRGVEMLWERGLRASGVDISRTAVETAARIRGDRDLCAGRQRPPCFANASVTRLPYADAEFDAVMSTDVLEHLLPHQVPAALAELARVANWLLLKISHVQETNTRPIEALHARGSFTHLHGLHTTLWSLDEWQRALQRAGCAVLDFGTNGRESIIIATVT